MPRDACLELHTSKLIAPGGNALIIGRPGTGNRHVAQPVTCEAIPKGERVGCAEADVAIEVARPLAVHEAADLDDHVDAAAERRSA